jgi:hypothetical protein
MDEIPPLTWALKLLSVILETPSDHELLPTSSEATIHDQDTSTPTYL